MEEKILIHLINDHLIVDVPILISLSNVSSKLNTAAKRTLSIFWNLPYIIITSYNNMNNPLYKRMLMANKWMLNGHSVWYLVSLLVIPANTTHEMLFKPFTHTCKQLRCFPSCHPNKLTLYDTLALSSNHNTTYIDRITKKVLICLNYPDIYKCILPIVIFSLPYSDSIVTRISQLDDISIKRQYYWILKEYAIINDDYAKTLDTFVKIIPEELLEKLERVERAFSKFRNILAYDIPVNFNNLQPEVQLLNQSDIFFDNDDGIKSIHATKDIPTNLHILTRFDTIIHYLPEGSLSAYIVCKCMSWLSYICKINLEVPNVLLTGIDSGFIWFPKNIHAYKSLYPDIENISAIAEHLIVHYMLGIDNTSIMINSKGIIHMKYTDLYTREDRIPMDDLILKLGGRSSVNYNRFRQTCIVTFLYIRRYYLQVMLFLKILHINPHIVASRFRIGLSIIAAEASFNSVLDYSTKKSAGLWYYVGY